MMDGNVPGSVPVQLGQLQPACSQQPSLQQVCPGEKGSQASSQPTPGALSSGKNASHTSKLFLP
jgi:hypothetical protein